MRTFSHDHHFRIHEKVKPVRHVELLQVKFLCDLVQPLTVACFTTPTYHDSLLVAFIKAILYEIDKILPHFLNGLGVMDTRVLDS